MLLIKSINNHTKISAPALLVLFLVLHSIQSVYGIMADVPHQNNYKTINFYNTYSTLLHRPNKEVFMDLLRPISFPDYPEELIQIKLKLKYLIATGQLEVTPILMYLKNFRHFDAFDLMITALLTLRDTVSTDCNLRYEIGLLITQSLLNAFQTNSNSGMVTIPFSTIPIPLPSQMSGDTIKNILNYFEYLFNKLSCRQSVMSFANFNIYPGHVNCKYKKKIDPDFFKNEGLFPKPQTNLRHPPNRDNYKNGEKIIPVSIKKEESPSSEYDSLIDFLPQPQTDLERKYWDVIQLFLESKEFNNYKQYISASDYNNKEDLLYAILKITLEKTSIVFLKEALTYYINLNTKRAYNYLSLLDLLPQPLDDDEKEKYEIVKKFLNCSKVYTYFRDIELSVYEDPDLLLTAILKTVANSDVEEKIKEAFLYYLNDRESLASLEVFTKKEVTKSFQLTKIISATLDVNNLSSETKLHFKKFFKYIRDNTKEKLSNFTGWSEVKTKGEFMKVFFEYLIEQTFVPEDIKESIAVLVPFIRMDGEGATPP